jgi:hypothetical protein
MWLESYDEFGHIITGSILEAALKLETNTSHENE